MVAFTQFIRTAALKLKTASILNSPASVDLPHSKLRIQRTMDSFQVTDLTHAGKRGKRVPILTIFPVPKNAMNDLAKLLLKATSWKDASHSAQHLSQQNPTIQVDETMARGVDVDPISMGPLSLNTPTLNIEATDRSFQIRDVGDRVRSTAYSDKPAQAKKFKAWLLSHFPEVQNMDFATITQTLTSSGIRFESY